MAKNSKVTYEMKLLMITLHNENVSTYEIAKRLGVTRDSVRYHLKKAKGTAN
jgi:predicted ArsR family transcriptional regulator